MTTSKTPNVPSPTKMLSSMERAKALVEATSSTVAYTRVGAALGAGLPGGTVGATLGVVVNQHGFREAITGQATRTQVAKQGKKKGTRTP